MKTKEVEPKRCPFCGSKAASTPMASFSGFYVFCLGRRQRGRCEAHGPIKSTPKAAIKAWNKNAR